MVGKNTPSAMVATFDGSPMPNHRISSGSSAILGIGNSADTIGRPAARAAEKMPMARPTARPAAVPMIQPGTMRFSEAVTCRPERAVDPQRLQRLHDGERARQEERRQQAAAGGGLPQRDQHGEDDPRQPRRGTGLKPPPRKGTGRAACSGLTHLLRPLLYCSSLAKPGRCPRRGGGVMGRGEIGVVAQDPLRR